MGPAQLPPLAPTMAAGTGQGVPATSVPQSQGGDTKWQPGQLTETALPYEQASGPVTETA